MVDTKTRKLSEKEKKELLLVLENRLDKELLKTFGDIVDRLVEAKKVKRTDVKILNRPPFIELAKNQNVLGLVALFSNLDFHPEGSDFYGWSIRRQQEWERDAALWRALVCFGVLCCGANSEQFEFLNEHLHQNLGFASGISYALENRDRELCEITMDFVDAMRSQQSIDEPHEKFLKKFLEYVRQFKLENSVRIKFLMWAKERVAAGDRPTTIEEMRALPGFLEAWVNVSVKTLRQWGREAGFVFQRGRPKRVK